jgi:hypothetical protein
MRRLHACRAAFLTVAVATLTLLGAGSAPAATDVVETPGSATAPIEILGNPLPSAAADTTPRVIDEGIAFRNLAAAPATSIDFTWDFIDANGAVVGEERTSARGRFGHDVPVEQDAAVRFPGYASGESLYVADEDTNAFDPVDHLAVAIDNATFADGSAWHGKTRSSNALPPQLVHDPSTTAAHVRITRIQSSRANSLYDRVDTLLSFANDGPKRIDAIEFTYAFYDLDGDVLFQQPVVVRGAYGHGAVSTLNPSTRVRCKGVVTDGGSVWVGWGSRAQYVAKIVIGVDAIGYSDGTIWSAHT